MYDVNKINITLCSAKYNPVYRDKGKINLVYFIRFIHYKLVSYDKQCLPHSSGEFKCQNSRKFNLNSPDECGKHCLSYETSL